MYQSWSSRKKRKNCRYHTMVLSNSFTDSRNPKSASCKKVSNRGYSQTSYTIKRMFCKSISAPALTTRNRFSSGLLLLSLYQLPYRILFPPTLRKQRTVWWLQSRLISQNVILLSKRFSKGNLGMLGNLRNIPGSLFLLFELFVKKILRKSGKILYKRKSGGQKLDLRFLLKLDGTSLVFTYFSTLAANSFTLHHLQLILC